MRTRLANSFEIAQRAERLAREPASLDAPSPSLPVVVRKLDRSVASVADGRLTLENRRKCPRHGSPMSVRMGLAGNLYWSCPSEDCRRQVRIDQGRFYAWLRGPRV